MKSIAIITARGGSKRIPRKNIKPFLGTPIVVLPIKAAIESGCFDEVMVSTDDEEIAKIAIEAGAKVPFFRSEKTSNDYATTKDVLLEVLEEYKKRGEEFDYMACLYPTNPFINAEKIKNGMELLKKGDCDEVIPIVQFSFPPQRCFVFNEDETIRYKWEEYMLSRSQDLEKMYHDAGQFYFYDVKKFIEQEGFMKKIRPIILPEDEVQDIDTEEDWRMAELKVEFLRKRG